MNASDFEWDDRKAAVNLAKHRVTFEMARDALCDALLIDWLDERHSSLEPRYGAVGMVENRLLFVAFVIRNERIRIISARRAEGREKRIYHEHNKA